MLKYLLVIVFCVAVAPSIKARKFRFDYQFVKGVNGWLKLHEVPASWSDARIRCQLEGSTLASPISAIFASAMKQAMNHSHRVVYSGIHATFSSGDYFSIEGVPLARISADWAPLEPDNFDDSERCLVFFANGTLGDVNCKRTFPYLCYKKKEEDMLLPSACGTVDPEYTLDVRTGSCYKFHSLAVPWSRAFRTCSAEGGHLAIINSELEAQVLKELFAKHPVGTLQMSRYQDLASIGFHDWGVRGSWLTIHGQTLKVAGYSKWAAKQPNNSTVSSLRNGQGQYCGGISRNALLDDIWCDVNCAFICEKLPESLLNDIELP